MCHVMQCSYLHNTMLLGAADVYTPLVHVQCMYMYILVGYGVLDADILLV